MTNKSSIKMVKISINSIKKTSKKQEKFKVESDIESDIKSDRDIDRDIVVETSHEESSHEDNENEKEKDFLKFINDNDNDVDDKVFELELPKQPKQGKYLKSDSKKTTSKSIKNSSSVEKSVASNVVYLGRIPHGFYEQEMSSYFSQFGTITALRLARNKKSGASKHYAFIQFDSCSVAAIVVETMHNYLLSNRLLQCKLSMHDHQLQISSNTTVSFIDSTSITNQQERNTNA